MLRGKRAARAMEGRTISRAELIAWDDSAEAPPSLVRKCHTLILHLDNGARVEFEVQESELMQFGVSPRYFAKG